MKIEIATETSHVLTVFFFCIAACFALCLVTRSLNLPFEKGYIQKQKENSQDTIWVKS